MCKIVSQKWKEKKKKKKESGREDQSLLISPGSVASCGAIDLKIAIGLLWQPLGQFLQKTWVSMRLLSMIKHLLNRALQCRRSGFPYMCRYFTVLVNTHIVKSHANFNLSKILLLRLIAFSFENYRFKLTVYTGEKTKRCGYDVCCSICNLWFIRTHSNFMEIARDLFIFFAALKNWKSCFFSTAFFTFDCVLSFLALKLTVFVYFFCK